MAGLNFCSRSGTAIVLYLVGGTSMRKFLIFFKGTTANAVGAVDYFEAWHGLGTF